MIGLKNYSESVHGKTNRSGKIGNFSHIISRRLRNVEVRNTFTPFEPIVVVIAKSGLVVLRVCVG